MKNLRIPLKSGMEQDTLTGWRRLIKSFERAGLAKKSKKTYNKRFRKVGKAECREILKK